MSYIKEIRISKFIKLELIILQFTVVREQTFFFYTVTLLHYFEKSGITAEKLSNISGNDETVFTKGLLKLGHQFLEAKKLEEN